MFKEVCARIALSCIAVVFAGGASAAGVLPPDDDEEDLVPTGKGWGERPQKPVVQLLDANKTDGMGTPVPGMPPMQRFAP